VFLVSSLADTLDAECKIRISDFLLFIYLLVIANMSQPHQYSDSNDFIKFCLGIFLFYF
jgi:hypothetical protein